VGIVEEAGAGVSTFRKGDRVLVSCISSCGKCPSCKKGMYSHCENGGGWILGNTIDGTQAEYVRIPFADTSLYLVPGGADEDALVMLSDILPTGFECGVLNGKVAPGATVAIVGAGPIGLAALLTAQFYAPTEIIMIDLDDNRLEVARRFGATHTINSGDGKALEKIKALTGGRGVDTAIEAVGVPATFLLCQDLVAPGGIIANIGVHGTKVDLHLESLWSRKFAITTRLVDPKLLITHRFRLSQILEAYDTFARSEHPGAHRGVEQSSRSLRGALGEIMCVAAWRRQSVRKTEEGSRSDESQSNAVVRVAGCGRAGARWPGGGWPDTGDGRPREGDRRARLCRLSRDRRPAGRHGAGNRCAELQGPRRQALSNAREPASHHHDAKTSHASHSSRAK
jgi:alcohol dehydrogenase